VRLLCLCCVEIGSKRRDKVTRFSVPYRRAISEKFFNFFFISVKCRFVDAITEENGDFHGVITVYSNSRGIPLRDNDRIFAPISVGNALEAHSARRKRGTATTYRVG
jgi:hypothetical protein